MPKYIIQTNNSFELTIKKGVEGTEKATVKKYWEVFTKNKNITVHWGA